MQIERNTCEATANMEIAPLPHKEAATINIAHIIHPVAVSGDSALHAAQPLTFESMHTARQYAKGRVNVELYAAKYADEENRIPDKYAFHATRDLDRHIALLKDFRETRKLAILKDILGRLYEAADADYLVYTNAGIALVPHFYTSIQYLIEQGYDAFALSGRIVPKTITDLNMLYALAGDQHPGADCFVFKRELYPLMPLNNICIDAQRVDNAMLAILSCYAENFEWFRDMHLAFRLDNDAIWSKHSEYRRHNRDEVITILNLLQSRDVYKHNSPLLEYILNEVHHPESNRGTAIARKMQSRVLQYCANYYRTHVRGDWWSDPLAPHQRRLNTMSGRSDSCEETANMKIAHIIHPVTVPRESDIFTAQPLTFESMHNARQYAKGKVNVELYATKYSDEETRIPDEYEFQFTRDIDRHIALMKGFREKRKLALIKDILDRLYEAADADYLVYTNVDIILVPHFYTSIKYLIEQGYDAFAISRRTVPKTITDLNMLYALAGDQHEGADCFVFKRELYPLMPLNDICIGTQRIDNAMLANLICYAKNFEWFRDMHLTFHLGNDEIWRKHPEYSEHNRDEVIPILKLLQSRGVYKHNSPLLNFIYNESHRTAEIIKQPTLLGEIKTKILLYCANYYKTHVGGDGWLDSREFPRKKLNTINSRNNPCKETVNMEIAPLPHKEAATINIAHIIHPVAVSGDSALHAAQPLTFESMHTARQYAKGRVNVELYAAKYADEENRIPDKYAFHATRDLDRHIALLKDFRETRKLAILKDILGRLYEAADADYLVYTNAGIALVPHFYTSIQYLIEQGYDAFALSGRIVPKTITDLNMLYALAGDQHPGADCFVFKRELYPLMPLNNICIDAQRVDNAMLAILSCYAENFEWFRDMHLAFHLGNDAIWRKNTADRDINRDELANIIGLLQSRDIYKHNSPLLDYLYNEGHRPARNRRATMPGKIKNKIVKYCANYCKTDLRGDWWAAALEHHRGLLNTMHIRKDNDKETATINIAHIIHPVAVSGDSALHAAQPLTFESMHTARQYAKGRVNVELYAAKYADEENHIPDKYAFHATRDLDRHIALLKDFRETRKLAILKDILGRLYEAADADYLVYTNAGIALVPHFYTSIQYLIEQGYDAFALSVRTIPKTITDLNMLYALAGDQHPGADCFVFKRELYPLMPLNNICIDAQRVDNAMLAILSCYAENFEWFRDMHLAFHLGNDAIWSKHSEYRRHNRDEVITILNLLQSRGVYKHNSPLLEYILNESHPPRNIRVALPRKIKYAVLRYCMDLLAAR